ncbi:hypothetical protein K493DRAFT_311577 [Basidiobolus meristosporus CBS 931.73]|uniref:Uncharacterized protein n=1 Tax=Basidiobolus meristosporus CBS 931.73 TaxID=1314790 RepID=A0A1Y1Z0T3_9FUNG|nr:hypothetical protein K493DRAFT_311577 [Basidiobolus meristosporus CBS 931.73]|eukprot:ORY03898.1 hypothetical protein K493DRAFT_311577 [Basidiobolus meristosporus CBS 931.73]
MVVVKSPENTSRLLVVQRVTPESPNAFSVSINVADHFHATAERLIHGFNSVPLDTESFESPEPSQKTIWIYLIFIKYVLSACEPDSLYLASKLFADFCERFLQKNEIHFVTRAYGREIRKSILQTYFQLLNYFEVNDCLDPDTPLPECPAIFSAADSGIASPFAIFGGQGNTGSFRELQEVWEYYSDLVSPFITRISEALSELAKCESVCRLYPHGFNILSWLEHPDTDMPNGKFLETAPVTFPMIGLVQLAHYYILCRAFRKTPGWMKNQFKTGVTGHSQGIVSAVAIASSETEDDFFKNSRKAVSLLFWIGTRCQQAYPITPIPGEILQECTSENLDEPTCMLSINGLTLAEVEKHVNNFNSCLIEADAEKRITISLINGVRLIACTGAPESLWSLNRALNKIKANPEKKETKITYSKRLKNFTTRFMPVTIPAHNELLRPATIVIAQDAEFFGLSFRKEDIAIPVFSIDTGVDMRECDAITNYLIDQVCVNRVHWQKATNINGITHVVDFGPGGVSGAGMLTHRNKEGHGVLVLLAGMLVSTNADLKCKAAVYNTSVDQMRVGVNWAKEFGPKLVRTRDGSVRLDTKYSRLTGKPPLLVGGMTPTTANAEFVSAVTNAGYNVEVGCGALYSPKVLHDCIVSIQESIAAGEGIVCNMVFINQFLWSFQFPGILNMRKREGIRIAGVCVAAGVPTTEYANKMCAELQENGIEHVSFKPDSEDSIRQVCLIAAQNPKMPIILQWTGGRSGGHHSYEDIHAPILETYGYIRSQPNIVLIIGSGFGDAEGTLPYITGDWSKKFGYAPMPFDGILFGTRMCVAKEAKTSDKIKDLIVQTPGVERDEDWEKTYQGPAGGIVTVESEYGEPIHNVATRGILFWKEMDDTIFSITNLDKRLEAILSKREYIIRRLNEDFQKVWFGKKEDGRDNVDLEEMTYREVLNRLIELVFVAKRKQWLDISHRNTVGDLITRIEERFIGQTTDRDPFLKSFEDLNVEDPFLLTEALFEKYPQAKHQLLTSEDIQYFVGLCRRKDKKPPPFVAVLDKELHVWFKRDSLWQAEDIDAVPGEDPDRVVILQGPVAVRHSKIANQPVKEILGEIAVAHVKSIQERFYANNEIPYEEYLGGTPIKHTTVPNGVNFTVSENGRTITYELGSHSESLPIADEWIEFLAGKNYSWFRALLTSPNIVRGKQVDINTFPRVFRPRTNQRFVVSYDQMQNIESIDVYGWARCNDKPSLEVRFDAQSEIISILLREGGNFGIEELSLKFRYMPDRGCAPIHEVIETRNASIKDFFYTLWFGNNKLADNTLNSVYKSTRTITQDHLEFFADIVRYSSRNTQKGIAFSDFAIVTSWESVFKTIFSQEFDTDITRLVHMRNGFEILDTKNPMKVGDTIYTESTISAVVNLESGKMIEVTGHVYREGEEIMRVKSQFLCRGKFDDYHLTFRKRDEPVTKITTESEKDVAALGSRSWLKCYQGCAIQAKKTYVFRLRTEEYFADQHSFAKINTVGKIFEIEKRREKAIGEISFQASGDSIQGNPVLQYLGRAPNSQVEGSTILFESGGYSIVPPGTRLLQNAPPTNEGYSQASEDVNPIHTNVYFADLAELPGPITHGMWTSAATRRFVETFAANNVHSRIRGYEVQFVGMVLPGDALETKLTHIGMKEGLKVIRVQTINLRTQETVLEGEALVEQPPTAYVFTGQGSQEVGMGMDLYASSPIAKGVWDSADKYLQDHYGVSILEIVRRNPKEVTVYFGNENGAKIRQNYINLCCEVVDDNGMVNKKRLFPNIDEHTMFHTWKSPNGLLNATQFTQPALTLMEKAALEDMRSKGIVCQDPPFAGHSLGEYAALTCIADVLSVETLTEVVFYRGLVMQSAVKRNAAGESQYAMCAVNPLRVHPGFSKKLFSEVVSAIVKANSESDSLLEIVNHNVENLQYVVTGDIVSLEALEKVLNLLKNDIKELIKQGEEKLFEHVLALIKTQVEVAKRKREVNGVFSLTRGSATIPLNGIDVPFHSSFLMWVVPGFRELLQQRIKDIDLEKLIGNYIPNLMGEVFTLEQGFVERVHKKTGSDLLKNILDKWDEYYALAEHREELGVTLVMELLGYQIASSVRWIETQDVLFDQLNIERIIEIGPSPTLSGMAERTIAMKYAGPDLSNGRKRQVLNYMKHKTEIYYQFHDEIAVEEPVPEVAVAAPAEPVQTIPIAVEAVSQGPAIEIEDKPVEASDILRAIVSQKIKKTMTDVPTSKTIKDISGGKSTLQNEIQGDLHAEFGGNVIPLKAEEIPLEELGQQISTGHSGNLGKYTSALVNKMLSSKMPAGFSLGKVKDYLKVSFGLGPMRTSAVLLFGTTIEPVSRLGSDADATKWLDSVVDYYSSLKGMKITKNSGGSARGGNNGATSVISSAELVALKMKQDSMLRDQLDTYTKYLGIDPREKELTLIENANEMARIQNELDSWNEEMGDVFGQGIKPKFTPAKARYFDSYWNWACQDWWNLVYAQQKGSDTRPLEELLKSELFLSLKNRYSANLAQQIQYCVESIFSQESNTVNMSLKAFGEILLKSFKESKEPAYQFVNDFTAPKTEITDDGELRYREVPRDGVSNALEYVESIRVGADRHGRDYPYLFVRPSTTSGVHEMDSALTREYLEELRTVAKSGISFANTYTLLTGCGANSIGETILQAILMGGGNVVATTSGYSKAAMARYRMIYEKYGSKESSLVIVPFNQGSLRDINALVDYIYTRDERGTGLGWDLDYIIPFAAISENGRTISEIDSKSELAHRIMLTNLIRILGAVKSKKIENNCFTHPAHVILPMSLNHGIFGNDGLYGESKIGLEAMMNKWSSEGWAGYLTIVGASIGWTRGTGLMNENNIISERIEQRFGMRTFSTGEMAFNLIGLMSKKMIALAQKAPLFADLNGGMQFAENLNVALKQIREELTSEAENRSVIAKENQEEANAVFGIEKKSAHEVHPRTNMKFDFPELKPYSGYKDLAYLKGNLDLERVIVVTGYGEVGVYGGVRTRWEMESEGRFSLEGCIEMAWIMGLIKYVRYKQTKDGLLYSGWLDCENDQPLRDIEIKEKYEKRILEHTGIRLIEPELFNGYNPEKKTMLQEVLVDNDLPPFEASAEEAAKFKSQHGKNADIVEDKKSGQWTVFLKKGATIYVPKALKFSRLVAGQIPTGWSAERYGIPKDIVQQVDPITLYCLVSTVEALVRSGITDPYEFYKYVHVSEVGNTSGGGVGAMLANRAIYKERFMEKPVQMDIMQESFVNTMPAWVNLLLLSSSGPVKTPVGACATAVESVDVGIDTILNGKAKIVVVGGYDDFQEEGSFEFANMKATSNAVEELAQGREPNEMSRPTTSSRGGFMESMGTGHQILMSAKLALEMGVPIYGVIAHSATATDKEGRSVPAPGQGILTSARETGVASPKLNFRYRARQIEFRRSQIKAWVENELENMKIEYVAIKEANLQEAEVFLKERSDFINSEAKKQEKEMLSTWGNDFYKNDNSISPLRGALAVFGLTIDDIGVASLHGTGTKANDKNECDVFNKQFNHLGRSHGNACPVVCQKYLTGHGKGAAAAWMLNGVLQYIETGIVPGNRNADNIDPYLRQFTHLYFPNKSVHTRGIKAGLLKSFGFGQVGGEILVIHPDYVFGAIEEKTFEEYKALMDQRQNKVYRYFHETFTGDSFVKVKNSPPYTEEQESKVYLNPKARASFNPTKNTWTFDKELGGKHFEREDAAYEMQTMMESMATSMRKTGSGVGVDIELISAIPMASETFFRRNFTEFEQAYCESRPDPQSSFAGRWSAKEAVFKAISSFAIENNKEILKKLNQGAGAPLQDIEITASDSNTPKVILHGLIGETAEAIGVEDIKVTISHSGQFSVAVATAV